MDFHDWLCILISISFIRFWISIVGMLSYFQPIFSMALHHACHNITALLTQQAPQNIHHSWSARLKKGRIF